MQTLAPLVDLLRTIAREGPPEPQTCRIRLYDVKTFRITIGHHRCDGGASTVWDRVTGEVNWPGSGCVRELRILYSVYYDMSTTTNFGVGSEPVGAENKPPTECEPATRDRGEDGAINRFWFNVKRRPRQCEFTAGLLEGKPAEVSSLRCSDGD
jgi:hypothetical protein